MIKFIAHSRSYDNIATAKTKDFLTKFPNLKNSVVYALDNKKIHSSLEKSFGLNDDVRGANCEELNDQYL